MESLRQDVHLGVRMLRRYPGFTATAVAALALGIGPNTAIFSLADAVLWRPLPYRDSDGLVALTEERPREGQFLGPVSPADFVDWREARSFAQVAAYESRALNLTGDGTPQKVSALAVTAGFLESLRVAPALGRSFIRDEEEPGRHRSVILSDGLWRRRYAAAPDVVGRTIHLDAVPYEVTGVLPPGFWWTSTPELLVPLALTAEERQVRALHYLQLVARLAPGVSLAAAKAEMAALGAALQERHPDTNTGHGPHALPLHDRLVSDVRPTLVMLVGSVGLVLAIACANVAILLLARGSARQKEMAIRMAIGAGRGRLMRQLVVESLLLACVGGGAGVLLASWGCEALRAFLPAQFAALPGLGRVGLDGRALGAALALTLAAGLLTGAASAGSASDHRLLLSLAHDSRASTGGRTGVRRAFVVAELALSLVLLVGTGLMLVSLHRVLDVRPGFEPRSLVVAGITLPRSRYGEHPQIVGFYESVLERVRPAPGVFDAAVVTALPLSGSDARLAFQIEGRDGRSPVPVRAHPRLVSPSYLQTMGIPLLRGRYLDAHDAPGSEDVVIVNEATARRFWPGEDPVGRRINFSFGEPRWLRIVGVVGDIKHRGLEADANPEAYLSYLQSSFASQARGMTIVVRGEGELAALAGLVRGAIAAADPEQPAPAVRPMADLIAQSVAPRRLNLGLLAAFALIALALTAEGLYGVMAYLVLQRTREIGVRMALGASSGHVVALVLRQLGTMALLGIVLGVVLALGLSRFLASQVFGITVTEPTVYLATSGLLLAEVLAAVVIPVRRAVRVDPLIALREGG